MNDTVALPVTCFNSLPLVRRENDEVLVAEDTILFQLTPAEMAGVVPSSISPMKACFNSLPPGWRESVTICLDDADEMVFQLTPAHV